MKKLLLAFTILLILNLTLNLALAVSVDLDKLDIAKFTISPGVEKTINFQQTEYTLTLESITPSEIKLTFAPTNLAVTIKKEKSTDIDIDNDKETDFSITYLSSVDQTATLEIKKIGLPEEEKEEEKLTIPEIDAAAELKNLASKIKNNLKIPIIIIVIIIILIILTKAFKRTSNPEKLYRKAEALHREAQEFHEDGDEETAQELYEKAEELREKARELEENQEV